MASLLVERFTPPSGTRDIRVRTARRARVANDLGGRTVWCSPRVLAALDRLLAGRAQVHEYPGGELRADDIVLLDDATPAGAVRECGAHAVVRTRALPHAAAGAVDAYVITWTVGGAPACRLAAIMPRAATVAEKHMGDIGDDLAWSSLLADVVGADRDERVGGRRHARPAVAAH